MAAPCNGTKARIQVRLTAITTKVPVLEEGIAMIGER